MNHTTIVLVGLIVLAALGGCAQQNELESQEQETPAPVGEVQAPVSASVDIQILGEAGFDHQQISISSDILIVTWINDDERTVQLVIEDADSAILESDEILPGERFEYVFDTAGMYTYYTEQYGIKGTLVVG